MKNQQHQSDVNKDEALIFEAVQGKNNIVKATSYLHGKKHEVFVYVMSDEEFDELIPQSERVTPVMSIAAG